MSDDGYALQSQQRSTAVFRIVNAVLEIDKGPAREQSAHLRGDGGFKRFFEQEAHSLRQSLRDLERYVADKTIADDHVHAAVVEIAAFNVANKVQPEVLNHGESLAGKIVSFNLFFADREQAHAGFLYAKDGTAVDLAHHRELRQIMRLGVHVGAHVNHDGRFARGGW